MTDFRTLNGVDNNFFTKVSVSATTFGNPADGYYPDVAIGFPTQSLILLNESTSGVVEYSFTGMNVSGELDPTLPSKGVTFDNRNVGKIWFRMKSGSAGPCTVSVIAWSQQ